MRAWQIRYGLIADVTGINLLY